MLILLVEQFDWREKKLYRRYSLKYEKTKGFNKTHNRWRGRKTNMKKDDMK